MQDTRGQFSDMLRMLEAKRAGFSFHRRGRIALSGEQSLIGAVIPPGVAHVNTVGSVAFKGN
jgi:hypothetical protein